MIAEKLFQKRANYFHHQYKVMAFFIIITKHGYKTCQVYENARL